MGCSILSNPCLCSRLCEVPPRRRHQRSARQNRKGCPNAKRVGFSQRQAYHCLEDRGYIRCCKNNSSNETIKIVTKIVAARANFWRLVSGFPPGGGRGGA